MADVATAPLKIAGPAAQTALVGELVYLRPLYESDAATGTSWRHTVFPESTSRVETWMKENLGADPWKKESLAIVRKTDDLVVGSINLEHERSAVIAWIRIDPIYGDAGLGWKAEAIVLAARWTIDERHGIVFHIDVTANETPVIATLEAAGFRQTARFREMRFLDGNWVDLLIFDYVNALWVAKLGDPQDIPQERTGTGEPRPVPARVTLDGDPPRGAILVGERVYLRAFEAKDAENDAIWSMRDPETFHVVGRRAFSPAGTIRQVREFEKKDPPRNLAFMVCLRENDEWIGGVELFDIDQVHRNAETGSWFRADYRGGGYGSEAKQLLLEYAFNHLRLHMVHSWVLFNNTRSAAALRKQGYKDAGRANWLYIYQGKLSNMQVFDLLADEWRALPRT